MYTAWSTTLVCFILHLVCTQSAKALSSPESGVIANALKSASDEPPAAAAADTGMLNARPRRRCGARCQQTELFGAWLDQMGEKRGAAWGRTARDLCCTPHCKWTCLLRLQVKAARAAKSMTRELEREEEKQRRADVEAINVKKGCGRNCGNQRELFGAWMDYDRKKKSRGGDRVIRAAAAQPKKKQCRDGTCYDENDLFGSWIDHLDDARKKFT